MKTRPPVAGVPARPAWHGVALTGWLVLWVVGAASCSSSSSPASSGEVCPTGQRTTLLTATLQRLNPSDPFVIPGGHTAWVSTTASHDAGGLFGSASSVATISLFAADASPQIVTNPQGFRNSADATVSLNQPNQWVRVPVGAGRWRIYTTSLGVTALPVTVVACPG